MRKEIGQKIRELRTSHKISQKELIKMLDISHASLSAYENGNKLPSLEILIKISKYFNVSLDWLCGANSKPVYDNVSDIICSMLGIMEAVNGECSVKAYDNTISFDFSAPSDNDTENSVSAEITSFFKEYAEMKEKLSSLPDKEFSDFAKDYYDMWLEKKLAYYATMPVHAKNEDV